VTSVQHVLTFWDVASTPFVSCPLQGPKARHVGLVLSQRVLSQRVVVRLCRTRGELFGRAGLTSSIQACFTCHLMPISIYLATHVFSRAGPPSPRARSDHAQKRRVSGWDLIRLATCRSTRTSRLVRPLLIPLTDSDPAFQ
jgi:hypothetical protein